ncbi:MAG: hypothetical protein ABIR62_00290 [Dokdonella sp.]|uniref:hypothetical protein n=1 Tax=Dokdonella sp. TaxID=2291710 RepID=UPI003264271F
MKSALTLVDRHRHAVGASLLLTAVVSFVFWPGVHGFWGRDDYMQLAFARMVGSPWPMFVHDHFFPAPGSVFRPLGFASMWASTALLGTAYPANAIADLLLHIGVSLALLGMLRRARIAWPTALLATSIFALHPAAIGTALWWSARFDLLAAGFIFLALACAVDDRARFRAAPLVCTLVASLAAMLCKETGLMLVPALSLLWLRWAWMEPTRRRRAGAAVASIILVGCFYLAWRSIVLGTATTALAGSVPLHSLIVKGVWDWAEQAPGYWTFWARLDGIERVALGVGFGVAAAALLAGWTTRRDDPERASVADVAIVGACLLLLPALLQSPVAALNGASVSSGVSAVETAMQARLHYLGIGGIATLLAALLSVGSTNARRSIRVATWAGVAMCVIALGSASRGMALAYAERSVAISAVARDAARAVEGLSLSEPPCHVVFIGFEPPLEWGRYVSMDSIIKALANDHDRVGRCHFHSNVVTYFNLLANPANAADALPYRPIELAGIPVPWLRIGDMTAEYLQPPDANAIVDTRRMKFLLYRNGSFDDVSDEVDSGRFSVSWK